MALIYKRGEPLKKTGIDAAKDMARKVGGMLLRAPATYVKAVKAANKRKSDFDDAEEVRQIERAFGSVEAYKKLDPMFRTRTEVRNARGE